jgi:hypothetical protein
MEWDEGVYERLWEKVQRTKRRHGKTIKVS